MAGALNFFLIAFLKPNPFGFSGTNARSPAYKSVAAENKKGPRRQL